MTEYIHIDGKAVPFELTYKKVKNINLRIRSDGRITVSASKSVPKQQIEAFLLEKAGFIQRALEGFSKKAQTLKICYFTEQELKAFILNFCREVYPYFAEKGVAFPEIKFRKMVSRWGSCHPQKGILTFSTNLMYAPKECVKYVVWHEFTHFLQANHSAKFYAELEKVCPDWKEYKRKLKEVSIR